MLVVSRAAVVEVVVVGLCLLAKAWWLAVCQPSSTHLRTQQLLLVAWPAAVAAEAACTAAMGPWQHQLQPR